uniref:AlNc14C38G3335 protein n=1 Tax=Albugo laibachii Nc14 TaxID=890382 RepID=F0W968_9STRA|nr:AlNc14C38G3335 [Albugo laibachii Nc14]|eukprot:CCA17681.1 AlNc14C38G3335 [Albugo laibachii Nc14]
MGHIASLRAPFITVVDTENGLFEHVSACNNKEITAVYQQRGRAHNRFGLRNQKNTCSDSGTQHLLDIIETVQALRKFEYVLSETLGELVAKIFLQNAVYGSN